MLANLPESNLDGVALPADEPRLQSRNTSESEQSGKVHQKGRTIKHGPRSLFFFVPVLTLVCATLVWGTPHRLWNWNVWMGAEPAVPFDYVVDGTAGRAFELLFWVTCAVQLRWIGNSISPEMQRGLTFRDCFSLWLFDTWNTPFICWILIVLLQGLTITFTGGLRLSLADANATLFGAFSALLGMSVRETRALLSRLTITWLKRISESKPYGSE